MKRHLKWQKHPSALDHTSTARLSVASIGNGEIYRRLTKLDFGAVLLRSAMVGILTLCLSSLSFAGSKKPDSLYSSEDIIKPLSRSTVEALQKDTGVRPSVVMIFSEEGPVIIGEAPGVNGEFFKSQEELWQKKGQITVERIEPTRSVIRFHASPGQACYPYPPWSVQGSFVSDGSYCSQ